MLLKCDMLSTSLAADEDILGTYSEAARVMGVDSALISGCSHSVATPSITSVALVVVTVVDDS